MGIRHDDISTGGTMSHSGWTKYNPPPALTILDNHASQIPVDRSVSTGQRLSMTSIASSGKRSSSSYENNGRNIQSRPSAIPRSTSSTSQARLSALASSRNGSVGRQPKTSPVSGSAGFSQLDQGLLARTMSSSQGQRTLRRQGDRLTPTSTVHNDQHSVLGVEFPFKEQSLTATTLPPRLIPELQALVAGSGRPIITPSSISTMSSPSTQFTSSPSPWSASTTTTSTSWSSTSPCILKAGRSPGNGKRSQTVPIPSAPRSRMPSLPVLQETISASKASSRTNLRNEAATPQRKLKKTPRNSPAPTPPPRSSSIKRTRSRSSSKSEDHAVEMTDDEPPPLPTRAADRPNPFGGSSGNLTTALPQSSSVASYHDSLQSAINSTPLHVSETTFDSPFSSPSLSAKSPIVAKGSDDHAKRLLDAAPIEPRQAPGLVSGTQTARSRLAKFSKLALFGRSVKGPATESEPEHQPRKLQRKGPTAGTGHEGYGRYSRKARKAQTDSSGAGTDSEASVTTTSDRTIQATSQNASVSAPRRKRTSQADLDEFASTRMKPVIIKGGLHQLSGEKTPSNDGVSSLKSTGDAKVVDGYMNHNESTLQSANTSESRTDIYERPDAPDSVRSRPSTSQDRPERSDHLETFRLLDPSQNSTTSVAYPYVDSWNTSQSSFAPSYVTSVDGSSDMYRVDSNKLEQQRRKVRRSKWNIFRRRNVSNESGVNAHGHHKSNPMEGLVVSINNMGATKPLPYYAMLDSETEMNTTEAIGDYLREAVQFADADDEEDFDATLTGQSYETRERVESVLLPSAPQFKPDILRSRTMSRRKEQQNDSVHDTAGSVKPGSGRRQPRLAQIGRIPKVIQPDQHKLDNRKSFSRPFSQMNGIPQSPRLLNHKLEAVPIVPSHDPSTVLLPRTAYIHPHEKVTKDTYPPTSYGGSSIGAQHEWEHPPILDRQSITSSSSEGMISIIGPPLLPTTTAPHSSRRSVPTEEDIWREYDDLIDDVAPIPRLRKSVTRIDALNRFDDDKVIHSTVNTKSNAPSLSMLAKNLAVDTSLTSAPVIFSSPEQLQEPGTDDEVRLRRSFIISALRSSMDPSSPFSIGDYLQEGVDKHLSNSTASGPTSPHTVAPTIALPALPVNHHYVNSLHMTETQRARNPVKHSELSYASLMISRWLSFGQVLFSPAHIELQRQPEKHVLVIDGLGNEDWSMYCAVTYQSERAYVYDLKELGRIRRPEVNRTLTNTPANFRRREIASFDDIFNFPDGFFSVIVVRFLPAMAEPKLKNIISECNRVLSPGGHIELMILDLDITNMGVVTRRALRDLKTKIVDSDPDVSLRPVIDNVQNVLADRGFPNLSRFVVGVPVVGKPPSITDSPVSSRSSGGSDRLRFDNSPTSGPFDRSCANPAFSLNDLVADRSDGADIQISKMVSRTARSWWQHCFEAAVISDGNLTRSILANKQVLSECKARASTFKMLIAYAQKPTKATFQSKRRTMSEPFVSTLAPS